MNDNQELIKTRTELCRECEDASGDAYKLEDAAEGCDESKVLCDDCYHDTVLHCDSCGDDVWTKISGLCSECDSLKGGKSMAEQAVSDYHSNLGLV